MLHKLRVICESYLSASVVDGICGLESIDFLEARRLSKTDFSISDLGQVPSFSGSTHVSDFFRISLSFGASDPGPLSFRFSPKRDLGIHSVPLGTPEPLLFLLGKTGLPGLAKHPDPLALVAELEHCSISVSDSHISIDLEGPATGVEGRTIGCVVPSPASTTARGFYNKIINICFVNYSVLLLLLTILRTILSLL